MRWLSLETERRLPPKAMIRQFPPNKSLLLIHSKGDELTPPEHGDILAVLGTAAHTLALRDERERSLPVVLGFLDRRLFGM
jgi:hypothetical protein